MTQLEKYKHFYPEGRKIITITPEDGDSCKMKINIGIVKTITTVTRSESPVVIYWNNDEKQESFIFGRPLIHSDSLEQGLRRLSPEELAAVNEAFIKAQFK